MIECLFFVWGAFGFQQGLANPCLVHLSAVSSFIDVFGTFLLVKLNNRICMTFVRHCHMGVAIGSQKCGVLALLNRRGSIAGLFPGRL